MSQAHVWAAMTLLSWGIGGLFDKKAVERSTTLNVFLICQLFNIPLLLLLLCLPITGNPLHIGSGAIWWEAANAVCTLVASLTYYYALSKSQASWVIGITAGYPLVGQLIACVALGEPFTTGAISSSVVISVGIAAIAYSGGTNDRKLTGRELFLLIVSLVVCTILWGILGIFDSKAIAYAKPMDAFVAATFWKAVLAVGTALTYRQVGAAIFKDSRRTWSYTWLSAGCLALGNIGFLLALPHLPAGYLIVVTACYPLVMYLGALVFLREQLNWQRVGGIALIVAGLIVAELARAAPAPAPDNATATAAIAAGGAGSLLAPVEAIATP